ncbi:hypothetical protein MKW92_033018 [Papaver armeniacum]|nr:hypothetical protein MKW92_033018 [Papaver armeniacum]
MSSSSKSSQIGLFLFAILALSVYIGWSYPLTLTCPGCDLKCKAICLFKPYTKFCKGSPGWFTDSCLCCCGTPTPVPSPPPPSPPPPPALPQDICLPGQLSLSKITQDCDTCEFL